MPVPDFKGHEFKLAETGGYRCIHCQMTAREMAGAYGFHLPDTYTIVSLQSSLDGQSIVPACVGRKSN